MTWRQEQEPEEYFSESVIYDEESGKYYQIKELPVPDNEEPALASTFALALLFATAILSNHYVQICIGLAALGYAVVKLFSVDATTTIILVAGSVALALGAYRLFRNIKKSGRGL